MAAPHQYELRSAADLVFEPDDGLRRELHDGVMTVVPPPGGGHSYAVLATYRALYRDAPADVVIRHDVGVHVGARRLYVPDLAVITRGTPYHDSGYDAGGVLLAVEAVSPGSLTMDRITKPAVYAEQYIPFYWRIEGIDDNAPRLLSFELDARVGTYRAGPEIGPRSVGRPVGTWKIEMDTTDMIDPG